MASFLYPALAALGLTQQPQQQPTPTARDALGLSPGAWQMASEVSPEIAALGRLGQQVGGIGESEAGRYQQFAANFPQSARQFDPAEMQRLTQLGIGMSGMVEDKPPLTYYRGTVPGETQRIKTGNPEWDSYLFASKNLKYARDYGSQIEKIILHPDAKVLYEGTPEWRRIAGAPRKGESLVDYSARAAKAAKEAGYDAAHFQRQGDVGTAIFNPAKSVLSRTPHNG